MVQFDTALNACSTLVLAFHQTTAISLQYVILTGVAVLVIARRPFAQWQKNVGFSLALIATILSRVSSQTAQFGYFQVAAVLAWLMVAILCIYLAGIIGIIVYTLIRRRLTRTRRRKSYAYTLELSDSLM